MRGRTCLPFEFTSSGNTDLPHQLLLNMPNEKLAAIKKGVNKYMVSLSTVPTQGFPCIY